MKEICYYCDVSPIYQKWSRKEQVVKTSNSVMGGQGSLLHMRDEDNRTSWIWQKDVTIHRTTRLQGSEMKTHIVLTCICTLSYFRIIFHGMFLIQNKLVLFYFIAFLTLVDRINKHGLYCIVYPDIVKLKWSKPQLDRWTSVHHDRDRQTGINI